MRSDEEFAMEAFSRFLRDIGETKHTWIPGADPPDFLLQIGQRTLSVEVTRVMQSFDVGHGRMPYAGAAAAMRRLAESLETRARDAGILHGQYVLHLSPVPILSKNLPELLTAGLRYIDETQKVETAEGRALWEQFGGGEIQVKKLSSGTGAVLPTFGPPEPKWGPDIVREGANLIQERIVTKSAAAVAGADSILLLLDEYLYAHDDVWEAATNGIPRHPFHTIARICHDRRCQLLFTTENEWREKGSGATV